MTIENGEDGLELGNMHSGGKEKGGRTTSENPIHVRKSLEGEQAKSASNRI